MLFFPTSLQNSTSLLYTHLMEHIKLQLLEKDREFCRTAGEIGIAEAFYNYLAENATVLTKGTEKPYQGREAVYNAYRALDKCTLVWEPQDGDVSAAGDFGYTWGTAVFTSEKGDVYKNKYLSVWKKQADGEWKVVADMGN